jgi:hypothetical protein
MTVCSLEAEHRLLQSPVRCVLANLTFNNLVLRRQVVRDNDDDVEKDMMLIVESVVQRNHTF